MTTNNIINITLLITIISFWLYLEKDNFIEWIQYKERKKYQNSDLYNFQKAKIRCRMIKHYKNIGYTDPSDIVEQRISEIERDNLINELYRAQKDYEKL